MYELLLYGQVPASRHTQLLNILAGLSAMQPQRVYERRVLFKPKKIPEVTGPARGGTQGVAAQKVGNQGAGARHTNTDVFYVTLVKAIEEGGVYVDGKGKEGGGGKWRMKFEELPVPGRKNTILRIANESTINHDEDVEGYLDKLGYEYVPSSPPFSPFPSKSRVTNSHRRYVQELISSGHQFILSSTILHLHHHLRYPVPQPPSLSSPLPPSSAMVPLDPSGTYILEAKIRITDATPALLARAEKELLQFKERMQGVLEMNVPERLALDTRALRNRPQLILKGEKRAERERPA
jgi:mediator of RNA polymerase II transcription subunit 18